MSEPLYECPNCGYAVTAMTAKMARYNFQCPRCKARTLSEFTPVKEPILPLPPKEETP